jgi:hypothetical protein
MTGKGMAVLTGMDASCDCIGSLLLWCSLVYAPCRTHGGWGKRLSKISDIFTSKELVSGYLSNILKLGVGVQIGGHVGI